MPCAIARRSASECRKGSKGLEADVVSAARQTQTHTFLSRAESTVSAHVFMARGFCPTPAAALRLLRPAADPRSAVGPLLPSMARCAGRGRLLMARRLLRVVFGAVAL
jgi:hypothetical protein